MDKLQALMVLLGNDAPADTTRADAGKYVICRCTQAGVHAGELVSRGGDEVTLRNSRRLYYWKPGDGAAFLSGIATSGLHSDSKVGAACDIVLTEVCEVITCTAKAQESIASQPDYRP